MSLREGPDKLETYCGGSIQYPTQPEDIIVRNSREYLQNSPHLLSHKSAPVKQRSGAPPMLPPTPWILTGRTGPALVPKISAVVVGITVRPGITLIAGCLLSLVREYSKGCQAQAVRDKS